MEVIREGDRIFYLENKKIKTGRVNKIFDDQVYLDDNTILDYSQCFLSKDKLLFNL